MAYGDDPKIDHFRRKLGEAKCSEETVALMGKQPLCVFVTTSDNGGVMIGPFDYVKDIDAFMERIESIVPAAKGANKNIGALVSPDDFMKMLMLEISDKVKRDTPPN